MKNIGIGAKISFLRWKRISIVPLKTILAIIDNMTFEQEEHYKFAPGLLGWKMRFVESETSIFETDDAKTEQFEAFREMFDSNWDGKSLRNRQYWRKQLVSKLKCEGLRNHNKSIDLLIQVLEMSDAIIAISEDRWKKESHFCFEVQFTGRESGITYKISIEYNPEAARIFANRFDDIDGANELDSAILVGFLSSFKDMMKFTVNWYNPLDGWEYICIQPDGHHAWPADMVSALVYSLRDDLNSALHPSMDTLRRTLKDGLRISWAEGESKISIYRLHCYLSAYEQINNLGRGRNTEALDSKCRKLLLMFSDKEFPTEKMLRIPGELERENDVLEGVLG